MIYNPSQNKKKTPGLAGALFLDGRGDFSKCQRLWSVHSFVPLEERIFVHPRATKHKCLHLPVVAVLNARFMDHNIVSKHGLNGEGGKHRWQDCCGERICIFVDYESGGFQILHGFLLSSGSLIIRYD